MIGRLVAAVVALLAAPPSVPASNTPTDTKTIVLWHAYRGGEAEALESVVESFRAAHPGTTVKSLMIPNEVLASKLGTAAPRGNGPDLFIFAHERVGGWADSGIVLPLDEAIPAEEVSGFFPETVAPLRYRERLYGLPLAFKSLALFHDRKLVPQPPATTDEMVAIARAISEKGEGRFGLVYETGNFYMHAPWLHGFGGRIFGDDGRLAFAEPEAIASFEFVQMLRRDRIVPEEVSGALVGSLFATGKAGMVISGPWFTGEIPPGVEFGVAPLPIVSATGRRASPFLTAEGVMVSAYAANRDGALLLARHLAGGESAKIRARVGRQSVANARAWEEPDIAGDPILSAFRAQLPDTVAMDNRPEMRAVWEPAQLLLRRVLRGDAQPAQAATGAMRRHAAISRTAPPAADARPYVFIAIAALVIAAGLAVRGAAGVWRRREVGAAARGWAWVAPAAVATGILVFLPFAVGLCLSFFNHHAGSWTFIGFANFIDIVASRTFGPMEPLSFYYALGVTIMWTVANLSLHVGIGLGLALLLDRPLLRLRPVYRVLLIVPWAVPNYITALIWKGLFHKQFGAINGLLEWLGIEGISWFSSFWTAFFANVCTNAWLGFPFMMVVSLGALQSIPKDLYEAAEVDGAGALAKLRHVTLPLLAPAMVPAVLLGTVWTFNQFNIVYLVSGGEPDNSTDILISEAYRWAFARQDQYGYAAAYAALIFVLLLGWSAMSARIARATEALR